MSGSRLWDNGENRVKGVDCGLLESGKDSTMASLAEGDGSVGEVQAGRRAKRNGLYDEPEQGRCYN